MSPLFRRIVGALELLAIAGVVVALVSPRHERPRPAQGSPQLSSAILTGYVRDAATGKPVRDAQVSTIPATETVLTNGQGLYVISLGQAFGTATVVADAGRYRQVRSTCVSIKAGLNTLGDVVLLHQDEDIDGECAKACADGEDCRLGHCVPSCAPACDCSETCEAGECVPNPNVAGEDSCGTKATWLGGGLCACKPGFVPSPQGRSCVSATEAANCPENAFGTESGCVCSQGFVPNAEGDQCVTPELAAVPAPLGDASIVSTWQLPMKMPRGLAVTDTAVWTVNLDTEALTQLVLGDDGQATIAAEIPLGADAWRITDLAATDELVVLARRGLQEQIVGGDYRHSSSMIFVDALTQEIKHAAGNNMGDVRGIAIMEDELVTREGGMFRRRSLVNATEQNLPLSDSAQPGTTAAQLLVMPQAYAGQPQGIGLSFTRNQLIKFLGTSYDGATFVARFDVLNPGGTTATAPPQVVVIPILGSHVAGFELSGSIGWLAIGGSGLEHPILEKVSFDDAL